MKENRTITNIMEFNKNTNGYSAAQLANGTPSDRVLILKSFFKMTSYHLGTQL
jgi:hypothetical protein